MIGVLIFPDFQLLDAAGPISVFDIAMRLAGAERAIKTIAVTPPPLMRLRSTQTRVLTGVAPNALRNSIALQ